MKELASKLGMSPDVLAAKLAQVLPQAIDKLTPAGAYPKPNSEITMNKALSILAVILFAGAVHAADSRTFITPPAPTRRRRRRTAAVYWSMAPTM